MLLYAQSVQNEHMYQWASTNDRQNHIYNESPTNTSMSQVWKAPEQKYAYKKTL
jgi:hypothetical protein